MRILLAGSLAVLLAPAAAAAQDPRDRAAAAPAAGTGMISGRVVAAGATPLAPVRRAKITLRSEALRQEEITDTDTEGRYRFDKLPPGEYRVTAEKPGFVSLEYRATRAFQRPAPVELEDGQRLTADFALPRGAALEGRILAPDAEPAQNVIVSAVRYTYGVARRRAVAVRQARTDDLGRFRIHSLPPGEYHVEASIDPLQALELVVVPAERPQGFARTFYPGTPRALDARRVAVTAGQEMPGLDFTLAAVPVAVVSGRVADSSGKPPAAFSVRLQGVGAPPGEVRGIVMPKTSLFEFRRVPPGDYWLLAALTSGPGAAPEFSATRMTVSGQDMMDISVTTAPGMALDGVVEVDGSAAALPAARLQIVPHQTEYEMPNPQGPAAPAGPIQAGTDGRFAIEGLFGPRLLRVSGLPATWALKGVWLGDAEITDTVTDFTASNAPRPLRVVVTDKTGSVAGTVTDARNRPVATYLAVVFSDDERHWTAESRFVKTAAASADGRFTIQGLLPGTYLVSAVDHLDEGSWDDPDVLRRLRADSTPVVATAGERRTLTLKLKVLP